MIHDPPSLRRARRAWPCGTFGVQRNGFTYLLKPSCTARWSVTSWKHVRERDVRRRRGRGQRRASFNAWYPHLLTLASNTSLYDVRTFRGVRSTPSVTPTFPRFSPRSSPRTYRVCCSSDCAPDVLCRALPTWPRECVLSNTRCHARRPRLCVVCVLTSTPARPSGWIRENVYLP